MIIKIILAVFIMWVVAFGLIGVWQVLENYSRKDLKTVYQESRKKIRGYYV